MENLKYDNSPLLKVVLSILRAQTASLRIKNEVLAHKAGLTKSQLSKIFNEQQIPTLDQLDALCHVLGLDISQVILETAEKPLMGLWKKMAQL